MICKYFLSVCAIVAGIYFAGIAAKHGGRHVRRVPVTNFTCHGRGSGYYADIETGCQVYHMCDGHGRQFSYSCPNTTLFQQRMLICDHWYMVNCSMSERDYSANLLIGQRDKPFVTEEEMRFRTPRPDILSVPPRENYYDGLREAESKYAIHPDNSITGVADHLSGHPSDLTGGKQNYRPFWSTSIKQYSTTPRSPESSIDNNYKTDTDTLTDAASQEPSPTFQAAKNVTETQNVTANVITLPQILLPPPVPSTTTEAASGEFDIDVRMRTDSDDKVYNFIKRFDPNSPDSHNTAMTQSEIIDLNKQLPDAHASSEEDRGPTSERTPRKNKIGENNINSFQKLNDKGFFLGSKFDTVNSKPTLDVVNTKQNIDIDVDIAAGLPEPSRELQPPKFEFSELPSTTIGPPIYYEWKWAVPALDLEPPKVSNETAPPVNIDNGRDGRSPFSAVTRPPTTTLDPSDFLSNVEYNISSYYIPDYMFPLDEVHSGYEDENAETSFHVKVSRPGQTSFGENPNCPQCHPAYLVPGTCEPCIVKR